MRDILIGKRRLRKKASESKIEKNCLNPECANKFLDTKNSKKMFCSPKCYRKIKGRKSTWPNKKKYQSEYRQRIKFKNSKQ